MSKGLGRNYEDPESRRFWESAEKAAANRRQLVVPGCTDEKPTEVQAGKLTAPPLDEGTAKT